MAGTCSHKDKITHSHLDMLGKGRKSRVTSRFTFWITDALLQSIEKLDGDLNQCQPRIYHKPVAGKGIA